MATPCNTTESVVRKAMHGDPPPYTQGGNFTTWANLGGNNLILCIRMYKYEMCLTAAI